MWQPPARPAWVDQINAVGAALGGPEHLVPLDPDELVATARRSTGLEDFGPDGWQEGYSVLLESIAKEARLHAAGRLLTRTELLICLGNRLRIQDAIAQDPGILEAPVERPIFICGLPRTGTSITHELLALDPRLHEPRAWEVFFSTPVPEPATYETDDRIAKADAVHRLFEAITPEYQSMHENGGALPVECLYIQMQEFASNHYTGCMNVPAYETWKRSCNWARVLGYQKRVMQVLQRRMPGRRWIMKSPIHLENLPELLRVFPDAHVIINHRNPLHSLGSSLSLMATLQWMRSDHVELGFAPHLPKGFAGLHRKVMRERASGLVPDARIVDLAYAELMRDPAACMARVYERLEMPFGPADAQRIRDYLASKPKGKHGQHEYSLADFAIDAQAAEAVFAPYCAHYGIGK